MLAQIIWSWGGGKEGIGQQCLRLAGLNKLLYTPCLTDPISKALIAWYRNQILSSPYVFAWGRSDRYP